MTTQHLSGTVRDTTKPVLTCTNANQAASRATPGCTVSAGQRLSCSKNRHHKTPPQTVLPLSVDPTQHPLSGTVRRNKRHPLTCGNTHPHPTVLSTTQKTGQISHKSPGQRLSCCLPYYVGRRLNPPPLTPLHRVGTPR